MPSTINGIGTHYHGHANGEARSGICQSCGQDGVLSSYDTRLWFVIFYIPIIPLGRKRIIDQCPYCKRHYVADADQWETQKQLNVSGALELYHSDPTPEHAMEAHQQLLNFHQMPAAADLREKMAVQFRQNAKVQAYLGMALAGIGKHKEANAYYQRAFDLRPDLPEARLGLADGHLRARRLVEARALLDFLEKPGAVQFYSLEPIETLADAFANAARRKEAVELYKVLLEALPQIGEIPVFRKKVKHCEKLLGAETSILPKLKFSWKRVFGRQPGGRQPGQSPILTWRGLVILGIFLAIGGGVAVVCNDYIRRHRSLYIVNAFDEPATVEVTGVGSMRVGSKPESIQLKEGHYHVKISGPVKEEYDVDVGTSYGSRWSSDDDLWLINVGGGALLLETRVTYRTSPPPPTLVPHFGRKFERVENVTNPFVSLPGSLRMKSNESRTLTGIERFPGEPINLISHLQLNGRSAEALQIAEWRLRGHPEDEDAVAAYVAMAEPKQAETFLHAGLSRRPVQIAWHRTYQNLQRSAAWLGWLEVEYNAMLSTEPHNSSLLYLRGRIDADPDAADRWYEKAREADPKNAYPYYALGYRKASRGDWQGARPLAARAVELRPRQEEFAEAYFSCRMALREFDDLEKEFNRQFTANPRDIEAALRLVDVMAAQERKSEAVNVVRAFGKAVSATGAQQANLLVTALRRHFLYSTGDFNLLLSEAKNDRTPAGRNAQFVALVEQGNLAEAMRLHPLDEPKYTDPYHYLTMGLAWAAANEPARASEWFRRGIEFLAAGSAEDQRMADLLSGKTELSAEKVNALSQPPKAKAILLAVLGTQHEERRAELFATVRTLNVDRKYPFHLIRRITEPR